MTPLPCSGEDIPIVANVLYRMSAVCSKRRPLSSPYSSSQGGGARLVSSGEEKTTPLHRRHHRRSVKRPIEAYFAYLLALLVTW